MQLSIHSNTSQNHDKSQQSAENIIHHLYLRLCFNPVGLWKENLSNKPVGVTIVLNKLDKS